MSIDWVTVGAQIANFLVLVWLLKRFLYRPILDGIDAREAEIAERMGAADRIRAAAQRKAGQYADEIAALQAARADKLDAARQQAEEERRALLSQTRARLEREAAEREADRAEAMRAFSAELQRSGGEALLSLTRKALEDLADETFEQRIVERALARLPEAGETFASEADRYREAVALSRDPMPEATRERLRAALNRRLPGIAIRFETDPSRAPGLGLRLGGVQVDWTVDSYLEDLGARLDALAEAGGHKGGSDGG